MFLSKIVNICQLGKKLTGKKLAKNPKKLIDNTYLLCYHSSKQEAQGLFFIMIIRVIVSEVKALRTKIILACTECKQRNYNSTKDKKAHPDRMEVKKFCRFCNSHTAHRETK